MTVYRWCGWSDRHKCYLVEEITDGSPKYIFRAYIKGNRVTLYPYRAMNTTELKRDKIDMSIFDIKKGE